MKKVIFTIFLLILVKFLIAQDIITKIDGTKINSKILETTLTEINYKLFNDLEGPTYTIKLNEISGFSYDDKNFSDAKLIDKSTQPVIVYFKNGSMTKGMIIEEVPNQYVKIKTPDNGIFIYKIEEIEKITKEDSQTFQNIPLSPKSMDVKPNNPPKKLHVGFSFGLDFGFWAHSKEFETNLETVLTFENIYINLKPNARFGFNLGILFNYRIKKWLEIQPEINYLNKGQNYYGDGIYSYLDDNSSSRSVSFHMKQKMCVNYIQIPVMVKFISKPGLYLSLGPYFEITSLSNIRIVMTTLDQIPQKDHEKMPDLRPINTGITVGGGYQKKFFGLEFRYHYDFLDLTKNGINNFALKNQMVQFSFYFYPGKK